MKKLMRWGTTLALLGIIGVGSLAELTSPALALPEQQVLERLQYIPLFTIVDKEGNPIVINSQNTPNNQAGVYVFMDPQDAIKTLGNLQKNVPDKAKDLLVAPVALSKVYQILKTINSTKEEEPPIIFSPLPQEVSAAVEILKQSGQNVENPQQIGIPLFFATIGQNQEFMVGQDSEGNPLIPLYFDKKSVQDNINIYKKQVPSRANEEIKIQVLPLFKFIQLLTEKDDQAIKIMRIFPPQESIEFVQRLQQQQSNQTPPK